MFSCGPCYERSEIGFHLFRQLSWKSPRISSRYALVSVWLCNRFARQPTFYHLGNQRDYFYLNFAIHRYCSLGTYSSFSKTKFLTYPAGKER